MLTLAFMSCALLTQNGAPASPPPGWSCEEVGDQLWRCENPAHVDFELSIGWMREWPLGSASSSCRVSGSATCVRARAVIGTWSAETIGFETTMGGYHYALLSGPRQEDPSPTWKMAKELLPEVRFHAVEEVCQRETGKPCEVTFGPMELQPNGDPRAVAK